MTKAIHEKHTYKEYVGVDACAVNLMRPAMYGAYHHITVMGREDEPCTRMYDVVGSCARTTISLPLTACFRKLKREIFCLSTMRAHGFAMGYNYNGKLKSAELLLKEDGTVEMIRRAETPEDYFATFDFCDILRNID